MLQYHAAIGKADANNISLVHTAVGLGLDVFAKYCYCVEDARSEIACKVALVLQLSFP